MSLEAELEIPVNEEAVAVREVVTILSMTTNELIGQLWELGNMKILTEQESHYKQMVIDELKLRMKSKTL